MTTLVPPPQVKGRPRLVARDASRARGLVDRRDLLEMLQRAVTKRVTVISAPPGSGKTSLLRAWAGQPHSSRRVAYIAVEREQYSEQRFWAAVLDALRGPTAASDIDQVVDSVLEELNARPEPVILVVDDLHELRSGAALTQLEYLLANLPGHARVVLSTRRDPSIKLHQLRLADEVAELRAADLQFNERETHELLVGAGISLSVAGVAALRERTEGWAAGLRLAVISLSGHIEPERFVAEFSGTDRAIGEYLMAEMLERQPVEVQQMLLRTSLVDRMNGPLADLLAGRTGSERTLLALEDANAFVVSLDARRTWFRYHQLLVDFLRLELRRTLGEEIPCLHRRAAQWFADRGDVVEAVRHTVAAGDWSAAARLVADHAFRWVLDGQAGTIRTVLRAFPDGAADHPDLALAHAALELNEGRMEQSAAHLAVAESELHAAPAARRERLAVAIASLRLAHARRSGQFSEVIEQVRLLDSSIADTAGEPIALDTELRGVALLNLGIAEIWTGRLLEAERHLSEGAALARRIGRPYLEVACRAHQGFPSPLVSVTTARERGQQTIALAESYGLGDRPILAPALGAVGGMAAWMGDLDDAERWLQRAWEVGAAHIEPAAAVLLHLATGMVYAGRQEQQSALGAFMDAAHTQSLLTGVHALAPRITGWLASTQARLGQVEEARATLAAYTASPGRMGPLTNAQAVISLAEGDAGAAVEVLRDVRERTPAVEPFSLVEAHLLAGTAYLRLGDRAAAAAAVEEALAVAEPDRLMFPFAMTDAAELLDALPPHNTAHGSLRADLVDLLRGTKARTSTTQRPLTPAEELSPSELRVVGYLPTNLTRLEIAHELQVSINTVNTHLRNVYAKLGTTDRSAAVRRARELRLLAVGRSPSPS